MAIGDYGNNNNNRSGKAYEPTYYSRYRFRCPDSKQISITFRAGLMVIEIGAVEENYKINPLIAIHLSPMKASLLVSEIDSFINYKDNEKKIDPNKAFGVNAGMGDKITYIAFSTDEERHAIITIGKFNGEGVVTESYGVALQKDYNYSLEWDNLNANELTKVYDNNAELIIIRNGIADFGRSMIGSAGYAALDLARFQVAHLEKRIDAVYDKLGIERSNYGNGNNYRSTQNNFLSNSNSSSKSSSLEDIEDLLV